MSGEIDTRERAVIDFAEQASKDLKRVTSDHVDALRAGGPPDETVLELLLLVGQATMSNPLADAMNVHPEDNDEALARYLPAR